MKIAVIGLGAVGAQTFWQLSRMADVEVHGYEAAYPGHPSAGAGGGSRLFLNFGLTDAAYRPMTARADEIWDELECVSGQTLRRRTGILLIGAPDNPQLAYGIGVLRKSGAQEEILTARAFGERFPAFTLTPPAVGVWDAAGGVISPELTVETTVALGAANEGIVHPYTRVTRLEQGPRGVTVHTVDAHAEYDRVVVACGGWTTQLLPELRHEVVTKRLTSAWYTGKTQDALRTMPPFLSVAPSYCYGIPERDGSAMKLGLGFNDHLSTGDPDRVLRELHGESALEQVDKFSWILRDLLPGLNPNPVRMNTYIESYTRSMYEMIGTLPKQPDITVLTGFSGHGFTVCTAAGEAGAQLAVQGETDLDLSFLREFTPLFRIEDPLTGATSHNPLMSSTRTSSRSNLT